MEDNNILSKSKKTLKESISKSLDKVSNVIGDVKGDISRKIDVVSNEENFDFSQKIKEGVISVGNKVKDKADYLIDNREQLLSETRDQLGDLAVKAKDGSEKVIKATSRTAIKAKDEVVGVSLKIGKSVSNADVLNTKLRKTAIEDYNETVEKYEQVALSLEQSSQELYEKREEAIGVIKVIEVFLNTIANTPKEIKANLIKIGVEIKCFGDKKKEIRKAEIEAKIAEGGVGAGASMSALGIAVATMGPTVAMSIATTFGVASTGTAISTLSGAAATNAALAWLGGGALAAGGSGMTAGSSLLALAGPVGWTIAGVMLTASVGSGLFASHKNKEQANKLIEEVENLELIIRKFSNINLEVESLIDATLKQMEIIVQPKDISVGSDYSQLSNDDKLKLGILVNHTLTLAELINKEILLDE